jgi:hypothetical protein
VSIEITLYPPKATREELVGMLKSRGYKPSSHLWDWPTGTVNLHWFESSDFTSFDGVEASVFPPSQELQVDFGPCNWALHTRTRAGASSGDRQQQNATIRTARKRFGGSFYNDWHGRNRYTPPDSDSRSPLARGIYLIHERTTDALRSVRFALPQPIEDMARLEGTKLEALSRFDPTRTLYNGLVPFAVAALEHFFSQAFRIFLRYDQNARERLSLQNQRKVEFADAMALSAGAKSIEDVVADWYSFQSIDSIHKAFNDWFGIDVWKLLRRRRKVGNRIDWLETRFKKLIDFRHGIVHRFELNPDFRKQEIEELLDLSILLIETFTEFVETSRREIIRD